jgi:autotransporter-associated beta strand protein
VNNTSGSATGTGAVTVNSGGILSGLPTPTSPFNVTGSISGAVTVNGGGTLQAQSGFTLTLGGLTLNTSAISDFDLGALTATTIVNITSTDGLSLAGASSIIIHNLGGLAAGTYRLFDYTGTALTNISNLSLGSTPGGGFTYSLSNNQTNTSIDLLVSTTSNQWANDASGNWSASGNWTGGVPNAQGAQANLFSPINVARTVTVDDAFTVGSLTFDNANAYSVVGDGVTGHGITFSNGGIASIDVFTGSHTISAPLALTDDLEITASTSTALTINAPIGENSAGRGLITDGAGTVTFGGTVANTYTGLTTVSAGTLNLNKTATVNAIGTGGVEVNTGATLALLASHQIADTATATVNGAFALGTSSETIGALGGVGSVTLGTGSVLTVGTSNNLTSQFGGVISGAGTLTKAGTGTFTLNGTNTFGGSGQTVTINAGSLQVGADSNLGNAANSLTFNGGTLLFSNGFTSTRNVTLNAGGGTINTANNAVTLATSGVISGTGALTKSGSGTLTLTGANTYSGGTILNAGSLSITSDGNLGSGSMQFNNGATLVTNSSFNFTHGFFLGAPGGPVQADGLAVSGIINVQSGTLTETTNGIIDGGAGGRLMKIGAGTLDLQVGNAAHGGNTAFSGGLYLHEGTLKISTIFAGGGSSMVTIDNGAALIVNASSGGVVAVSQFKIGTGGALEGETTGNTTFGNGVISNISGQAGGLTFIGPGKIGLGGNNTFEGTVVIGNAATPLVPAILSISRDVNLGAVANQLTIGNGSTLMIEDGIDATQSVGSAAIAATFSTSRQINLTGSTATIDVKNIGDGVNYNATFNPGGLNTLAAHVNVLTVDGLITGTGQLIKAGVGTLVLTNTGNNYTGGTVINGGMLSISDPAALGADGESLVINPTGILQATASFSTSRAVT